MQKLKIISATLLLTIFWGATKLYSQAIITTEEEYNYVIKGYKVQIENGLDMKKGYYIKDFGEWSLKYKDGRRGFIFKGLYRMDDTKPCAIMAIYQKNNDGRYSNTEFYCIPTEGASSLWDRTLEQLNEDYGKSNANQIYQSMLWAVMHLSSQEIGK